MNKKILRIVIIIMLIAVVASLILSSILPFLTN